MQPTTPPTAQSLGLLLQRIAARDRPAFAMLYSATSAKLYGIVLRILKRRDIAEEVLQDVYVKIWERAGDFEAGRASPITWMATIARNRALDEVRKVAPVSLEDMPEGFDPASDAEGAFDLLARGEDGKRLANCLGALDPQKREIVMLAYLDGLSREELGQRFSAPVATIKTWLHRSLAQLKECLGA